MLIATEVSQAIDEVYACESNTVKNLDYVRAFISDVLNMAKERGLNCFVVSDGASGIRNNGNPAVRNARECQIKWERSHGYDPDEDWSKE